ncbi:4-(cytidine 5'-diphospho)-2-C-methyl-D-erythritol kinase [Pseudoalteromonas luteoviolacea]|uniref:4-diphosphocytidyl-2-C-methyl-D-erythritol kinase n=1 Tax=Pseudoalteromonas luteoviolacea TaxID=43657 RepID=A0A1C0TIT9_9GAMM|nr:4-(cytidine 5'-diphospho)-2-C-methyl-D-erythritol kinase [Pseudoalteromonas luteoviolacea]MBQ4814364.1 4-(cytidine 5'-diphospho)-2-C-methyl-D-erythritol kinase [Pseudoalteromonas luteoviolacea]OCQ18212.1 4-(cytidine 5'-diphospho)-2-C-methyl-D-erythritol kinase [Pseudoalteromonas luteoviolacea]
MNKLTLTAPAKLNLFLHINGRREDGYHELESLFTMLDFGDELTFELTESDSINISGDVDGIPKEDNLIYKAAMSLRTYRTLKKGVTVHLTKHLPMGGGVGGGSSDAATTLLALNVLWNCQLSLAELAVIGLQLGADVPVFINGKTALAQGVGEQLTTYEQADKWYLVIAPGVHVSTAKVFTDPALPRSTPKLKAPWSMAETRNDCEELVKKLYPEVEKTLTWLLKYAPSRMTGTGSCCFATFDDEQTAQRVLQDIPASWQGFVAKSASESITHKQLATWLNKEK